MAVPRAVRRLLVVTVAGLLVLAVFTTRTRDSTEEVFDSDGRPRLGKAIRFQATAYCKGETTAAGIAVRHGMAAADAGANREMGFLDGWAVTADQLDLLAAGLMA